MSPLEQAAVRQLQLTGSLSLDALGGEASLIAAGADIAVSRLLPEFAKVLLAEWDNLEDRPHVEDLLVDGLRKNPDDIAFLDTLDVIMSSSALKDFNTERLADLLMARAKESSEGFNIRRFAVEGLLRLAFLDLARVYDLLAVLNRLRENDEPRFLESMPRLIGAAYDKWRDPKLLPILERLTRVPVCAVEGAVELGFARLSNAFDGNTRDAVLAGLRSANASFADALSRNAGRLDARAFSAATRLLLAFAEGEGLAEIELLLNTLEDAIVERRLWERNTSLREWLRYRIGTEGAWLRLGQSLKKLASDLRQPSWLNAVPAILNVLSVYAASRNYSVIGGGGLERIIQPDIEAAFLRREGLRHHLDQYLASLADVDSWRGTAQRLRERLDEASRRGDPPGKLVRAGRYPLLEAEFPDIADAELPDSQLRQMEEFLRRYGSSGRGLDLVQERIVSSVREELRTCPDFVGDVANAFSSIVELSVQFLADRQNIGRETAGDRMDYLFAWKRGDTPPRERLLQMDYRDFLVGSLYQRVVRAELRDLAGGRADIVVDFRSYRFVVEAKRELTNASRDSLREYLGQAGLYQGTSVKLGFLLVLDLTPKLHGVPALDTNVWVEKVPMGDGGDLRHIVVLRVPGNRIDPHATATPTAVSSTAST
jgi:hypothetical protein